MMKRIRKDVKPGQFVIWRKGWYIPALPEYLDEYEIIGMYDGKKIQQFHGAILIHDKGAYIKNDKKNT